MERFLLFPLFLYLLSGLLVVGSTRSESRYSLPMSKYAYLLGTLAVAAIFFNRISSIGEVALTNYFDGTLFTLVVLGIVFFVIQFRVQWPIIPAALSFLSVVLGILALIRFETHLFDSAATTGALKSHTICMFVALAAFSLSFIFSLIFLVQDILLKKHRIGQLSAQLPSLELSNRINLACLAIGTSALLIGVVGGIVHLMQAEETRVV